MDGWLDGWKNVVCGAPRNRSGYKFRCEHSEEMQSVVRVGKKNSNKRRIKSYAKHKTAKRQPIHRSNAKYEYLIT